MRLATITDGCVRVYEVGHAARSAKRSASSKIISTEILPPVASLMRFARSYEGRRPPLKISERCEGLHPTESAKAACVMRPSIQEVRECDLTMPELCHWQSSASSQNPSYQKMDLLVPANTIECMSVPAKKTRIGRPVAAPDEASRPVRKLYLGEWLHRLGVKQVDLAEGVGIGESYVSSIVSGVKDGKPTNPTYSLVFDIADFLYITVDELAKPPPPVEEFDQARKLSPAQLVAIAVRAKRAR